ncbi:phosphopentomutase [Rubrobacter xylanophilus DSM 9941]|uniref:Phosphopentomutase n=1 Tax=Rubrobacter xylanophilus (strain DSM 9941 / JCM 11954 / NBRC 16129 / PRD-1) TaxID=266117 RepID=Q1AYE7_RUBXD|nr:phosphopentomutase [Rubrobacter xylanophilus]ABG03581.1 phosphopentomutase [Rubrobacter xylanophilus DSM 9941]
MSRDPGRRAAVVVLDGVGAGGAPDAARFGDEGANTLSNTARAAGGLRLPNLQRLGLGNIVEIEGVPPAGEPRASWGLMTERSAAKATLAGHWEIMGLVLREPLPTYPEGFPEEIISRFERETGRKVIGNRPASGTQIIEELGPEQERTGAWIVYTSADSVFQVAAHTGVIPLQELYEACEKAHRMLIGEGRILVERVIARPYHGKPGAYERENENRHDYGIEPFGETYLDRIKDAGHEVVAVGKVRDIFDGRGITRHLPAPPDDAAKVDAVLEALGEVGSGLIFANLVDFDAKYGHRRDPEGMAQNLERFDRRVPELLGALGPEDLLVITADHGNDPTFRGTDHTRERVPLLAAGGGGARPLGVRETFADAGASAAAWLGVRRGGLPGESWV